MNDIPFYFGNKSQTNCTRNTVKYSTVFLWSCAKCCCVHCCFPTACKLFHIKIKLTWVWWKAFFWSYKKLDKFQAEKFLISGYLLAKTSGYIFLQLIFLLYSVHAEGLLLYHHVPPVLDWSFSYHTPFVNVYLCICMSLLITRLWYGIRVDSVPWACEGASTVKGAHAMSSVINLTPFTHNSSRYFK